MTQNVNLFDPSFRKQRLQLSFATLVKYLGLAVVVLLALQFFLQHQLSRQSAELRQAQDSLKDQRSQVERLAGQTAARKPDPQLEAEIGKLEVELRQAQDATEALKGGAFGNQQGFAEYLRAFSRQSVDGLWLTGFTITGGGELEIRGRVLRPDLVPSYLQRLNREQVLAGRSFARLEMSRPDAEPAADKDKRAARAPRFLEFSLATKDAAKKAEGR